MFPLKPYYNIIYAFVHYTETKIRMYYDFGFYAIYLCLSQRKFTSWFNKYFVRYFVRWSSHPSPFLSDKIIQTNHSNIGA